MDPLTIAEQKVRENLLKTPHELFAFLDQLNYFTSKDAIKAFEEMVERMFGISDTIVITYIRKMLMDKVKTMDQNGKFKTSNDIFTYLDNLGFFFNDSDGRTRCMHEMEQM